MADLPDNVEEVTQQTLDRWNAGDLEGVVEEFWTDDFVLVDTPDLPDAGTHRGRKAAEARIREYKSAWGDWDFSLADIRVRDDGWTIAVLRAEGRGPAGAEEWIQVTRWANERQAEVRMFGDRGQAREAGWDI